jgi:hypothetical protein
VLRSICVALILVTLGLAPSGAGSTGAALSIVDRQPLTMRGRDFKPYERVRVVAIARVRAAKTVRASRRGAFVVRFAALDVPRCGGVFATARGRAGSVARLKIPLPACQPTAQP